MQLTFSEIREEDIAELTSVMTRAFDDDSRKHLGADRGGPDGYDNGDFFRQWLFAHEESRGYKILMHERIIGGFIVWIFPHGRNVLGTIFVDPEFQDRGVGTRAWAFIERAFPATKSWYPLSRKIWMSTRIRLLSYSMSRKRMLRLRCVRAPRP